MTRRFECENRECPRKFFSGQIDELVTRRGQSTLRFDRELIDIGLYAGGAPGARLTRKLETVTSGSKVCGCTSTGIMPIRKRQETLQGRRA